MIIIGIPGNTFAQGTIKHMLEDAIAEAVLEEQIKEPKEDKIDGYHMHVLSMAHFDRVVAGLRKVELTKHWGALQVINRDILLTKPPPVINLSYNGNGSYFRLDGRVYPLKLFISAYGFRFLDPMTMQTPIRDEKTKKWLSTGYWLLTDQSGSSENMKAVIDDLNGLFTMWGFLCHAHHMGDDMRVSLVFLVLFAS